ncbi:c-type cytochrome [Roseibium sp.]|uniref:c-type cytochrome n=1 Tax=Roseibium sp. TaxID=1936156 RepID=UPI003A97BA2F
MKRFVAIAGVTLLALTAQAHAEGDAAAGEKVFKKCKACHDVGDEAKNKVGPQLNGIVGRAAGAVEGFKYSKALLEKAEEGLTWNEEELEGFLTKPKQYLPKTKMAFAGLRKEADRANIIAYLKQFQ